MEGGKMVVNIMTITTAEKISSLWDRYKNRQQFQNRKY